MEKCMRLEGCCDRTVDDLYINELWAGRVVSEWPGVLKPLHGSPFQLLTLQRKQNMEEQ